MLSPATHRFTFAIIGDTHVKPESGDQSAPWKVNELATERARWIARDIERYAPDFIVHLGDLVHPVPELSTFGEAVELTKTIFGATHNRLHVIPGNHDIGDKPNKAMPAKMVRDDWIALYEKSFGPCFHSFDRDDCRFVFLNDPVMNSGSPIEARQRAWLAETLASAEGRRLFVFMHYPLFLLDPGEPGNYDNIDEPARADILALFREYKVEAAFAGHVHNIFYHRVGPTEFYVMPATSFVRQDFSELFRTDAIHENGRNDAEKLGFALVEVHDGGHVVHYLRSYGESLARGDDTPVAVRSASRQLPHAKKAAGAPIGVYLRHEWAEIVALPHNGPMDEFLRKKARNDYLVAALWRLGIQRARVPLDDLLDERTGARMADLVAIGHRFTVFAFGVPEGPVARAIFERAALVERFECVLPGDAIVAASGAVSSFRRQLGRPVVVSPLASSATEKKVGSRIELFVSHGFRPDQLGEMERVLDEVQPGAIESFVIRVGLAADLAATAAALSEWQERHGCKLDLHLRVAADNPATNIIDDDAILAGIVEFYLVALAHPELAMFVDPLMDVDRGYFVRHGLIDRRCNLRKAGLAVEALAAYLGDESGGQDKWSVGAADAEGGRALHARRGDRAALVLLPRCGGSMTVEAASLRALGLESGNALAVPLDRPWTIDADLGDDVRSAKPLPSNVSGPTMLIGLTSRG